VKPAPAAPAVKPAPAPVEGNEVKAAEATVIAWAKAWSAKDMGAYLGAYAPDFKPQGNQTRAAWEKDRRDRIVGKSSISVAVSDLTVSVNGNEAQAKFRQAYKANALAVSSRKTLSLKKVGTRWLITQESTGN
jgi:ketosteroid isomerase-like protein